MTKRPGKVVSENPSGEAARPEPEKARVPMRRFTGVHSLTHGGNVYVAGPDGVLELPEGETWYHQLIESGVLEEVSHE